MGISFKNEQVSGISMVPGIDITIGNDQAYGGILIRSVARINPNSSAQEHFFEEVIHGPLKVQTELTSNFTDIFGVSLNIFRLEDVCQSERGKYQTPATHFVKTPRIGLNRGKTQAASHFAAPYRYVLFPQLKTHPGRELLAREMKKKYNLSSEEVKSYFGYNIGIGK